MNQIFQKDKNTRNVAMADVLHIKKSLDIVKGMYYSLLDDSYIYISLLDMQVDSHATAPRQRNFGWF